MINHVVLLKFKAGVGEAEIEAVERLLDELPNQIVEIQTYEFGRDVVKSNRSYDFALVALFANLQALERYQTHAAHQKVLAEIKKISQDIVVADFEGSNAGSIGGSDREDRDPIRELLA
jgi:hypothetical protein